MKNTWCPLVGLSYHDDSEFFILHHPKTVGGDFTSPKEKFVILTGLNKEGNQALVKPDELFLQKMWVVLPVKDIIKV